MIAITDKKKEPFSQLIFNNDENQLKTVIFSFSHNGFALLDILATEDGFPKNGNNCTKTNQSKLNFHPLNNQTYF